MNFFKWSSAVVLASLLAACGGGDSAWHSQSSSNQPPLYEEDINHQTGVTESSGAVLSQAQDQTASTHNTVGSEVQAPGSFSSMGRAEPAAVLSVYSPQQIRAAYRMPVLPTDYSQLTDQQRAALGAGQTIYVIAAYHAPNLLRDLDTFARQFGLPGCRSFAIPVQFRPLEKHDFNSGCEIAEVNLRIGENMTTQAPAYVRSWAMEQTLDVQWAHAIAPLARIVVVKSRSNFVNALMTGIMLSERLGPGVISMSFVAAEDRWSQNYETLMPRDPRITMLAATGDRGSQSNWPSSSPLVLGVSGTSLTYTGAGERSERVWSRSGGGYSPIFVAPDYQDSLLASNYGLTGVRSVSPHTRARSTSDLTFNADPSTGQYVVFTEPGRSARWYSMGGTSIGTPQWAGIIAVANSQRELVGKSMLGNIHQALYSGQLSGGLVDIVEGANGTCSWCFALPGYDTASGWGSPNVDLLLPLLVAL